MYKNIAPRIIVLLDDSESLRRTDFHHAEHFAQSLLKSEHYCDFEIRFLSQILGKSGSPLGSAVRSLTNEESPPAAIVLLSDGVVIGGIPFKKSAEDCRSKNIPLFCVPFGPEKEPFRLRLIHLEFPYTVGVDEPFTVGCVAEIFGLDTIQEENGITQKKSSEFQIVLESAGKTEKTHKNKTIETSEPVEFSMSLSEPGVHQFQLYVDWPKNFETAIPKDFIQDSSFKFSIFVRKEPRRILLLDATPRHEYRFLRELLRGRPGWELHTVLLDAAAENVRDDPIALTPDSLKTISGSDYDLLILGDVGPELFDLDGFFDTEISSDDEFLKPLCSFLFINGTKNNISLWSKTKLRSYIPIDIQNRNNDQKNEPENSSFETKNVRFLNDSMTPFYSFERPELEPMDARHFFGTAKTVRPGTRILAETEDGFPLIALGKYQNRFVYWLGTDNTWTWQQPWKTFIESTEEGATEESLKEDRTVFHEFWLRTLRLLTENENERISKSATQEFFVSELQLQELRRLRRNTEALQEASKISGGTFFDSDDLSSLLTACPQKKVSEFEKTVPIFPKSLLVVSLVTLLFLSWKFS